MEFSMEEWGPGLVFLGAGITVGIVVASRITHASSAAIRNAVQGRKDDLTQTRASVITALGDLERSKGRLDPADYEAERTRLLSVGAEAIKALEVKPEAPSDGLPAGLSEDARRVLLAERERMGEDAWHAAFGGGGGDRTPKQGHSWEKIALVALACVLTLGGLTWMASQDATVRIEDTELSAPALESGPPQGLTVALAANPDDILALNGLTDHALATGDLQSAMSYNGRVLELDAANADARVHRASLRLAIGQGEEAREDLAGVLKDEPNHTKALVYYGLLSMQLGDPKAAVPALERALAGAAAGDPYVMEQLALAKTAAGGGSSLREMAETKTAAATGDAFVRGTITLSPALAAQISGNETLFVALFRDGVTAGPPLAAKKLRVGANLSFAITSQDLIGPARSAPVPDKLSVRVNLDVDGNVNTKEDRIVTVTIGGLEQGAVDVAVVLDKP
jgi:tetratricopeptide (TPR) repeat protein